MHLIVLRAVGLQRGTQTGTGDAACRIRMAELCLFCKRLPQIPWRILELQIAATRSFDEIKDLVKGEDPDEKRGLNEIDINYPHWTNK